MGGAIGNTTALSSVILNAATELTVNGGSIRTTGAQSYNGNVTVGAATIFTSTTNGAMTFAGTLDGAVNVTMNTGGVTTLSGVIGGVTPLTSLTTDSAGGTTLSGGAISAVTSQTYNDPVTLGADTTLTLSNGNVVFGSIINSVSSGAKSLTISLGAGDLTLGGAVGAVRPLAAFSATNTGATHSILIAQTINTLGDIVVTAGNNVTLSAGSLLSSAGSVSLTSVAGVIQETGAGLIHGDVLTLQANAGVTLNAANTVNALHVVNAVSGNVSVTNTASVLTVSGITMQNTGGDVSVTNTGASPHRVPLRQQVVMSRW